MLRKRDLAISNDHQENHFGISMKQSEYQQIKKS